MFSSLFIDKLNFRMNEVSERRSIFVHYLCERFGLLILILLMILSVISRNKTRKQLLMRPWKRHERPSCINIKHFSAASEVKTMWKLLYVRLAILQGAIHIV